MRKWADWIGMIVAAVLFIGADVDAATQEGGGKRVTASSWVRAAIRRWPILGVLIVAEVVWHFVVQAWFPGLPL